MINNILKAWNAGFVRRWHTQPRLVDTIDPCNGHAQRCTVLLLLFWPDSTRDSIIDTIIHDQGEDDSGDMARPSKQRFPEIKEMMAQVEAESIEAQGFPTIIVTGTELARRKFVDLLDSYLWMLRHKPQMASRPEWVDQYVLLIQWATDLDIFPEFETFVEQVSYFYD